MPRPLTMQDLHHSNVPLSEENPAHKQIQSKIPDIDEELPIAICRSRQDPKPSNQLKESLEYLS